MNGSRIKEVKARQVLDSKGRPVVETEIYTENGKMGRAGGVIDDPNAELAIALGLPIMKTGAPRSGERTIFTNTGLRVEEQLKPGKTMADVLKVPGFERLG